MKKKFKLDIKNMGVNIDKNEYNEIVLSNSSHPEFKGVNPGKKSPVKISPEIKQAGNKKMP